MNNKSNEWEIKEEGPGMVRIIPVSLGKIPTLEEYKQKAKELLTLESKEKTNNIEKLKDESMNASIAEDLLLRQELEVIETAKNNRIHQVIFSHSNGDVMVNNKNFDSVFDILTNSKKLQQSKQRLEDSGICLEEIRI